MSINKITSQSVQPVDVRDQDFRHGGKDSPVTFPTADPVNDHASTINSDTPPASEQSASTVRPRPNPHTGGTS